MRDMTKELKGQELVDFLMVRFNMTEDEALQSLAENIGDVVVKEENKEAEQLLNLFNQNKV